MRRDSIEHQFLQLFYYISNIKTSNMKCFVALSALLAVASAAPQYAPAPVYAPAPAYGPAPVYADVPPAYDYTYGVADSYHGVDFGANENRNGYSTAGGYRVALPDGRVQVVTYNVADALSGYVADVKYEGTPVPYAAPAPAYAPAPAPAYAPAPVRAYAPAPVYAPVRAYAPAPVYGRAPVLVAAAAAAPAPAAEAAPAEAAPAAEE